VLLPPGLRGLPRETWVLALVAFCVALGFGIVGAGRPAVRAGVRRQHDGGRRRHLRLRA
jgi:hypothetical protein